MTKEELHEIYVWAWHMSLRACEIAGHGELAPTAHKIADARIAWVEAKAKELKA